MIPAILVINFEFENKKCPPALAVAPNEIKTTEKRKVKKIVHISFLIIFEILS